MENTTNGMKDFEQFASARLNNHLAELNVRYENRPIDRVTLEKAYDEHREIFSQEMDNKIGEVSLLKGDQSIHTELQTLKENYLTRLRLNSN
ncbi:MAG: hypothetical protein ABIT58_08950 [Ferruginibacter sp.]